MCTAVCVPPFVYGRLCTATCVPGHLCTGRLCTAGCVPTQRGTFVYPHYFFRFFIVFLIFLSFFRGFQLILLIS
ncbi:unnamed protein product [Meloidogyne enterolobii]|uniref:Uncharacterized protein n=1 Tax=Meloidogyne enterolobii TaxID=390850 RepID=A0ACB0Z386_MELEN